MNMNANLNLDLDIKKILPLLRRAQPYLFGLFLIGVFAYTSYTVNAALNVKPDPAAGLSPTAKPTPRISFDKATIDAVKKLDVVKGEIPIGELGKNDPFN